MALPPLTSAISPPSSLFSLTKSSQVRQARLPPLPLSSPSDALPSSSTQSRKQEKVDATTAPPPLSDDAEFLLHLQPSIFMRLSTLSHSLLTADHRPPPSSPSSTSPLLSPYIPLFQTLLSSLLPQPSDPLPTQSLKSCPSARHFHTSLLHLLVQFTQQTALRYSDLHGGRVEQALHFHTDVSHILDCLSSLPSPLFCQGDYVRMMKDSLIALEAACVSHCEKWMEESMRKAFGKDMESFPLILPAFPPTLPTLKDSSLLFPNPSQHPISPYLSLYLTWFVPLHLTTSRLHPSTHSLTPSLLSPLHTSLFTCLSTLLGTKTRVNGNGAALLVREVEFISGHSAVADSQSVECLRAALHVLTHPSLYRSSLPETHRQSSASVAPLGMEGGEVGLGVKLPGYVLGEWKEWMKLYSKKHAKVFKAGMRANGGEQEEKTGTDDGASCGWWH